MHGKVLYNERSKGNLMEYYVTECHGPWYVAVCVSDCKNPRGALGGSDGIFMLIQSKQQLMSCKIIVDCAYFDCSVLKNAFVCSL